MAQSTYLQNFTAATASFISSGILEPVCEWIRNNPEEEVTPQKLMEVLQLPAPRTPQRSTSQSLASSGTKRSRRAPASANRPQCEWVFTKGDKVNEQCTGYAVEGSKFCSACKNKKGAGGTGRSSKAGTSQPKGTRGAKSGLTPSKPDPKAASPKAEEISVDEFGMTDTGEVLYIDINSGFIFKLDLDEASAVVGICDDPGSHTMRGLSPEEKVKAKQLFDVGYEEGVILAQ